jgi:hypothetical protein
MIMKITSIRNINTDKEVCGNYLNKDIDLFKSKFEIGKDLQIMFTNGKSFSHEVVKSVNVDSNNKIVIKTSRKLWILEE